MGHSKLTVARFVEAVGGVAVRRVDGDLVPAVLQPHGGVDDEPLCAADAQVRMEEDDVLHRPALLRCLSTTTNGACTLCYDAT